MNATVSLIVLIVTGLAITGTHFSCLEKAVDDIRHKVDAEVSSTFE